MKMKDHVYNVLFICTGNSARSILAESLVDHWGGGRFKGYSAGSFPKGAVHPYALDLLQSLQLPSEGMRSKRWDEFAKPGAPVMDLVVTVCDNAAGEICPVWPGHPITGHWGVEDPSQFQGSDEQKSREFIRVARILKRRIESLAGLPVEKVDRIALARQIDEIGRS